MSASQAPFEIGLKGGEVGRCRLHTCQPTHVGVPMLAMVEVNTQPQPSSTVNTRTPSVPHMSVGGMGDDLTDMGISATAACSGWGESRLFSRITRSTRLTGNTDATTDPKPSP